MKTTPSIRSTFFLAALALCLALAGLSSGPAAAQAINKNIKANIVDKKIAIPGVALKQPDLTVSDILNRARLEVLVKNVGNAQCLIADVKIVATPLNGSSPAVTLGTTLTSLSPGQRKIAMFSLPAQFPGDFTVTATVKVRAGLPERNTGNNALTKEFRVP